MAVPALERFPEADAVRKNARRGRRYSPAVREYGYRSGDFHPAPESQLFLRPVRRRYHDRIAI